MDTNAARIIADINNWSSQLHKFGIRSHEELEDPKNFHAVSMLLFSIINGTINLGEEIVATRQLGFPASYREVFEILNRHGIINLELTKDMSRLAAYRNMFVQGHHHQHYRPFTEKEAWDVMQRIGSAKVFVNEVKKALLMR